MNVSQVARIIAVWMMIVTPGSAQFRDFVGIPNTQDNNWENNLTTCFRRLGGISLWRRRLLMHEADHNFDYGEIENELDTLERLNNESKLDYLTRRYEATEANYSTDLGTQLDLLFAIFKIGTFLSDHEDRRVTALKRYLMTFYQLVPYHNICHGIAVGLYSASIYAANPCYKT